MSSKGKGWWSRRLNQEVGPPKPRFAAQPLWEAAGEQGLERLHPEGKTCADCVRVGRCKVFLSLKEPEQKRTCSWAPSRFKAPEVS